VIYLYLAFAVVFACCLAGYELDKDRPRIASLFALFIVLAWPLVLGIMLRGMLLSARDAVVAKWKARRMRA
jgi:hypothetical protein